MDKTSSRVALVAPAPATDPDHAQPAEPPAEEAQEGSKQGRRAALAVACVSRVFVIALLATSVVPSAWRARRDPVELVVIAGPLTLLAALFACQHRAERLAPGSPPGERRRLHLAAWVLCTLILCLSAYQISRTLPAASAIAVWFVVCFLVLAFFYMLRKDQQYQELDGGGCDDADAGDDGKALKTARPADDLV